MILVKFQQCEVVGCVVDGLWKEMAMVDVHGLMRLDHVDDIEQ